MSNRRDSRSPGNPEGSSERRPRSFLLRDDLFEAFDRRANELECSVDWLVGEAMKRLLADEALQVPPPPVAPVPAPRVRAQPPSIPLLTRPPPLPPPPPPSRRATGSFVGQKSPELIALRLADQRVVVDRDRFVLGRSARDAHLALRDPNVSRQHAIIERAFPGWTIVDMASTNGVLVNGVRVTRAPLRAGDVLEIGPFTIAVERA